MSDCYKTNPNSTYEITYSCSMVLVEADESVNQLFFGVVCDTVTLVYSVCGNPSPDSMWMFSGASARGPNAY